MMEAVAANLFPIKASNWYVFKKGAADQYEAVSHGYSGGSVTEDHFLVTQRVENIDAAGRVKLSLAYEGIVFRQGRVVTPVWDRIPLIDSLLGRGRTGYIEIENDGLPISFELPKSTIVGIYQHQYGFSLMYVPFPYKDLNVGDSWSIKYDFSEKSEILPRKEKVRGIYTVIGTENYKGCECIKIEAQVDSIGFDVYHDKKVKQSEKKAQGFIYLDAARRKPFAQILTFSETMYSVKNGTSVPVPTNEFGSPRTWTTEIVLTSQKK